MRFLILAAFLISSTLAIKVPATSYFTYHHGGSIPSQNAAIGPQFSQPVNYYGSFLDSSLKVPTQMCPPTPPPCTKSRYRSLDGSCNNLYNPSWGVANSRYGRLLTPRYGDGVSSPTASVTGHELPNARLISLTVFGESDVPDRGLTIANMQWGQIVTHDMSLTAGGTQSRKHTTRCCTDDGKLIQSGLHSTCFPIIVPKNDPAHSQTGTECMNFVRTLTDRDNFCPDKTQKSYAEQLSVVTAYMDLSHVYGNSEEQNRPIRSFVSGRLLVDNKQGFEYPPQHPNASTTCDLQTPQETCYLGGDMRINQNPGLTIMQIILLREHNRIADNLQALNQHWDDETIFQEARRINIAQFQHVNYYEWLPIMLGHENMLKNELIYQTSHGDYVNDYNPNIDPSVLNSHATAAFRYFHTQIEGQLDFVAEERTISNTIRLSDWFNRPVVVESGDNFDFLSRGMTTQPQETTDINNDVEVKHFLFRRGRPFGLDLKAFDIQRNRDHGLASYNDFREFCGVGRAHGWQDFIDFISPAVSFFFEDNCYGHLRGLAKFFTSYTASRLATEYNIPKLF
ncbi:hypothetical protein ACKWTF_006169 [Chironomus riparius]